MTFRSLLAKIWEGVHPNQKRGIWRKPSNGVYHPRNLHLLCLLATAGMSFCVDEIAVFLTSLIWWVAGHYLSTALVFRYLFIFPSVKMEEPGLHLPSFPTSVFCLSPSPACHTQYFSSLNYSNLYLPWFFPTSQKNISDVFSLQNPLHLGKKSWHKDDLIHYYSSLCNLLQPHWAPCGFSNMPSTSELCTGCSVPRYPPCPIPHHLQDLDQISPT